jgi:hypothetical protein
MSSKTTAAAATATVTVLTVNPLNFENNAFTDFAPLLTLFGEEGSLITLAILLKLHLSTKAKRLVC